MSPPARSDEFLRQQVESRHAEQQRANENLRGDLRDVKSDLKDVVKSVIEVKDIANSAVSEVKAARHQTANVAQDVCDLSEKVERHDERLSSIEKMIAKAIGYGIGASAVLHWGFDLISPWTRHLLDGVAK
jgi:chromosome segregation ATPase